MSTRGDTAKRAAAAALAALGGLVSGYAALAVAELVSVAVRPEAGPVTAVGGAVIDRTPAPVKDWAIHHFGEDDKLVLQLGILAALALFAAAAGVLALRRPRSASLGVLLFGAVGALAATARPDSTSALDALPSLAGAATGSATLYFLSTRLPPRSPKPATPSTPPNQPPPATALTPPSRTPTTPTLPPEASTPTAPAAPAAPNRTSTDTTPTPSSPAPPPTGPTPPDRNPTADRTQPSAPAPPTPPGRTAPPTAPNTPAQTPPTTTPTPPTRTSPSDSATDRTRAGDPAPGPGQERTPDSERSAAPDSVPVPPPDPARDQNQDRDQGRDQDQDRDRAPTPTPTATATPTRRTFLLATAAAAALSTGAWLVGRRLKAGTAAEAEASRSALRLPAPASPAPALPRGVDLKLPGLTPYTTSNDRFYRVDTAIDVPRLDANRWRLRVHGKGVDRELSLDFQDLLRRELVERDITMTCVSNEVGGPYVGSARWLGVRLADLLREAGVRPPSKGGPADQLVARSVDGMTIGTPVETVMDGRDALLAVGMNGEPLPFEHGFPVRMLVPGLYGYVSACKWIEDIELTTFDAYDPYWVERDWAREAPIKTQSRIDTPKPFARPAPGRVTVAGVAWAQHKGIARVEVSVDDGPWHEARLAAEGPLDTWRQWSWQWPATPGTHTLHVRATDRTGTAQTAERTRTMPDGASGRHSVVVTVT
ncbi:molybdopterin-dependent oxidoreductase [Streptomyces formicae]|uniref:Putative sulfite oxidase n=1 Tax=Streptomyces formicae TaxID=1616117 RepID=A0A291QCI1_9ACTN|nr:molybdopterin-dependent oxidoreductase [Streptomyces formicae]ATL29411.1 putative sulfite oxidase [Streptomyces formicae]